MHLLLGCFWFRGFFLNGPNGNGAWESVAPLHMAILQRDGQPAHSELTTSKVLTMEWVDGFRLTDDANLDAYGLDRKQLVDTLVQCSLRQILENGFFHGE